MSPSGTGGSQSTTCTGPGMKEIESESEGDGQHPLALNALNNHE